MSSGLGAPGLGSELAGDEGPKLGGAEDYVIWAALSCLSCLTMGCFYFKNQEVRKLPGTFIIYRALCELCFSVSLILWHLDWISCEASGLVNQVAQTGSNMWIVVMCFDLVQKVLHTLAR